MSPRIAILIPNFEGGGAQRVALTQARELLKRGFDVRVWALEHRSDYAPDDIDVGVLTTASAATSKLRKLLYGLVLPIRLARRIRKEEIDLCISHLERADFLNVLSRPLGKHKSVGVVHSHLTATYEQEGYTWRSRLYLWLVKRLERYHSRLVAVSQEIAHNLGELGLPTEKIQVIHNPFPVEEIHTQARAPLSDYAPAFEGTTLLSIGRLSRQKGLWHVLKVLPDLKQSIPDLSYVILGDGPMRDYHITLARTLGLKTWVTWENPSEDIPEGYDVYFLGFRDNPFRFLAKADTFVLPSHYEGLPNVIIESLICGTPVVATDSQAGPRELLAPGTDIGIKTSTLDIAQYGILTPLPDAQYETDDPHTLTEDETTLLEGLKRMLTDHELRETYQHRSAERVDEFRTDYIMPQWEKLIEEVTTEKQS